MVGTRESAVACRAEEEEEEEVQVMVGTRESAVACRAEEEMAPVGRTCAMATEVGEVPRPHQGAEEEAAPHVPTWGASPPERGSGQPGLTFVTSEVLI